MGALGACRRRAEPRPTTYREQILGERARIRPLNPPRNGPNSQQLFIWQAPHPRLGVAANLLPASVTRVSEKAHVLLKSIAAGTTLALSVLVGGLAATSATVSANDIVAKVDGATITEQDVALAREEIGSQLGNLPPPQQRRVLIEFLIENQLIAKAATGAETPATDDFKSRMDYWRRRALRDSYFQAEIENKISEADAKAFYESDVKETLGGEEIKAAHILVANEDKAKEVYELLAHDGDFAELAKEHSLDPGSKANGGELGFFGKGQMVPEFEAAAFKLKDGEISDPVKSQYGWHIIKVTERRSKEAPAFDALKERIRMVLLRRKAKEVVDGFRASASIEYVDPEIKAMVDAEQKQAQ